jgi:hypothetical protein
MQAQITWPAERFYWAVVVAPAWKRAGPAPAGLIVLAQDDLPVPADDLHAVALPLGDGRVLIAGARRDELSEVGRVESLCPAQSPPGFEAADLGKLEFLSGPFEPVQRRRARLMRAGRRAAIALLVTMLVAVGLVRRAAAAEGIAEAARTAWAEAAQSRSPAASDDQALFQLRRRVLSARSAAALPEPVDATPALAAILAAWPEEVASQPQSISVAGQVASVSVVLEDAAGFLAKFHPPPGWRLDQPMLNAAGSSQRLVLTFHRMDPAP